MIAFPNAKINLGLHVVEKRTDGYHNIETVFYPIPLCDALEMVPSENTTTLQTYGIELNTPDADNLVMKALRLFRTRHPVPELQIHLKKNIPAGAGLGGGSSDATCMLHLLNQYTQAAIPEDELEQLAAQLGADCPFFVRNKPVLATGRGNQFTPISISLKGYIIYLVKPDVFVSTQAAYAGVKPAKPQQSLLQLAQTPVAEWKNWLVNDFEAAIVEQHPSIGAIKATLYSHQAVYAAMSGSGSAVFGLFETDPHLSFPNCFSWKGTLQ